MVILVDGFFQLFYRILFGFINGLFSDMIINQGLDKIKYLFLQEVDIY